MKNNLDKMLENKISLSLKKEASEVKINNSLKENLLNQFEKTKRKQGKTISFVWSKNPLVRLAMAACLAGILFSI